MTRRRDYGPATTGNRAPPRPARPVVAVLPSSQRGLRAYKSLVRNYRVSHVHAARIACTIERQTGRLERIALLVRDGLFVPEGATSWLQTHGYWEGS